MSRRRKACPTIEAMEPKQLLSTVTLSGGGWAVERTNYNPNPGVASHDTINGVANVGPLGVVHIHGTDRMIRLSNARGTLTLSPGATPAPRPLPPGFMGSIRRSNRSTEEITIIGGTGAYAGYQGSGTMTVGYPDYMAVHPIDPERVGIGFAPNSDGG